MLKSIRVQEFKPFAVSFAAAALLLLNSATGLAGVQEDMAAGALAYSRGDVVEALRLYRRAAETGHAPAQVRLGYIYDKSEFNEEAVSWFRRAAEQGNAEGQYYLGEMYSMGEGITRDYAQATSWIRKAAEQNLVIAMKVLAKRYEGGTYGLPKDEWQSLQWWQRAAQQDDGEAIARMAKAYRKGELGLTADAEKARIWESKIKPPATPGQPTR